MVAVIALAGCGGAQSRYARYLSKGQEYLAKGQLEKARVEARNALQIQPKAAEALFLSGQVAERQGNLRGATGFYLAAVEARPDYPAAVAALASIYVVGGVPERAMTLLTPVIAKHPDDPELLVMRGGARIGVKDLAGGRADAERCLQLDADNERAIGLLAGLDRSAGDSAKAIARVRQALVRRPDSVELRQLLVTLYLDDENIDAARQEQLQLIKFNPHDMRYRYQLARFLGQAKRVDEGEHVLEEAVRVAPDDDEPKIALVSFLAAHRSPQEAEKRLRDYIAHAPRDFDLRLFLGAMLQQTGANAEALKIYEATAALAGERPPGLIARARMAEIEAMQGHIPAARQLIADLLKSNPHDLEALALRGRIELEQNDPVAAVADLRTVLRDRPQATDIRRSLARAYLATGDFALAEETLRVALDNSPTNAGAAVELAALLVRTNRVDQAVTLLESTVKRVPADPLPREGLTRAYMAKGDLVAAGKAAEDLKILSPKAAIGFYLAGLIDQAEKKWDESAAQFEQALALQPNGIDVLLALTHLQVQRGHTQQAIARTQSSIAADPNNAMLMNLLAELYIADKDAAEATAALNRAIGLAPHWGVPYANLARLQLAAGDSPAALRTYRAGLKGAPADSELATELAALYEKDGHIDEAIAQLDALLKLRPGQPQIASALAILIVTYKSDKASLDRARDLTAAFARSQNGALLDARGWVLFKRGEYADARSALESAVLRSPDSREIRYHLALAELRTGASDLARSNLELALAGAARFTGATDARAVLASLKSQTG